MVVEDEVIIAMYLEQMLRGLGYQVVGRAATPADAISKAAEAQPDVVMMDVRLRNGASGIPAAESIWRDMGIAVVFATAHTDEATLGELARASPFGFVHKPYDDHDVHDALEKALSAKSE